MHTIRCAGRDALTAGEARAVAAAAVAGGVILYPTDTLYGLGVDPFSAAGVAAVYRLKGRAPAKPLPVLLAEESLVGRFAAAVPAPWRALMARFWPGPLTLLFPALPGLPAGIRSAAGRVALRVPGSALCRSILAAAGGALTGTSANPAGGGGTGDPAAALGGLAGPVDIFMDAGTLSPSPASTLLEMDASGRVRVLRMGAVAIEQITRALGERRLPPGGG
jgi:L-threonylcarbamoyladenylate synthase